MLKRVFVVLIFFILTLFILPSRTSHIFAALSCSSEGGVCCATATNTCSTYISSTDCVVGRVCCMTTCVPKPTATKTPAPTNTPVPTAVPCAPLGVDCGASDNGRACCSPNICKYYTMDGGIYYCTAPTAIPTRTPTPTTTPSCVANGVDCGASNNGIPCCTPNICKYYNMDGGIYYCTAPTAIPTRTPTPTNTIGAPTPTSPTTGAVCPVAYIDRTACSDNTLMYCSGSTSPPIWKVQTLCLYSCTGGAVTCDNSIVGEAFCCPNPDTGYCEIVGCQSCSPPSNGNASVQCYDNAIDLNPIGGVHCVYKAACDLGCSPISETCGGDARCDIIWPYYTYDPPWVSHIDNCNGIDCAPPCTIPTPTGGVGLCTPNCSGSGNVCFGIPYNDPTGCGTCLGSKACVGILRAQALVINNTDTSCTAINASTTLLEGSIFSFNPPVNPTKTQPSTGVAQWLDVTTDGTTNYAFSSTPLGQYAEANVCLSRNGGAWTPNTNAGVLSDDGDLYFRVGYVPQMGWFQSEVGNVYAATQLTASIPQTATNPYLSLVGSGGTAGIASYWTGYDLSLSSGDLGESNASPPPAGWLVKHVNLPIDYYAHFDQKLINETKIVVDPLAGSIPAVRSCSSDPCIYTIADSTTFSSPITIGATEKIIVLVNTTGGAGTVTISGNITVTAGGFFALIVNGNITIDPAVATLQGIYIATNSTHTSVFTSGNSAVQLAVKGSVIADGFSLQRDLGASNATTPGESFVLDPQLLFTMPDSMKDSPYVWQEVAP